MWRPPPGWPKPPPTWVPAAGWNPPPEWPAPPPGWEFWTPPPPPARVAEKDRRGMVLETWFVELAFLVPSVLAAVGALAAQTGGATITRFPRIVSNPAANLILGVLTYLGVGTVVPIALLLLSRTGQKPAALGLGRPRWRDDVWPGLGMAASGFGVAWFATSSWSPWPASTTGCSSRSRSGTCPPTTSSTG